MNVEECCLDEDEFEERIRLSKGARAKMLGQGVKELHEDPSDPIGDADAAGKRKYQEADIMSMRAAKMDNAAILYLQDRFKNCYRLRALLPSHSSVLNCFLDDFRSNIDCECEIRKYLIDVMQEKVDLAADYAKHYKKKEVKSDKKKKK